MTRTMYDALPGNFAGIPPNAQMVAGYIDGGPGFPVMTDKEWALFPNAVHVRIATQAGTNDGHVLDIESGNAGPADAPGWVKMRRASGLKFPSIYCSQSDWPVIARELSDANVDIGSNWWIASYQDPPDLSIYDGTVAHQWGGNMDGGFDVSSVLDYWPGVDSEQPTPTVPKYKENHVWCASVLDKKWVDVWYEGIIVDGFHNEGPFGIGEKFQHYINQGIPYTVYATEAEYATPRRQLGQQSGVLPRKP